MGTKILHWLAVALIGLSFAAPLCAQLQPRIGTVLQPQRDSATPHATLNLTRSEQAWLAAHPVIRVAFDGYFPPYSFVNDQGQVEGLAVDVFALLQRRLGIRFEPAPQIVWKDLYAAAQRREVDVVATMGHRPERERWFSFTRPYIFKSLVIVTRREEQALTSADRLDGHRIALVEGYQYVRPLLQQHPAIVPYFVPTMRDGLLAVATGKADAAISFLGAAYYLMGKHQMATLTIRAILAKDAFSESIGVRNDWPVLAGILDKGLASIPEKEMQTLRQRWLGPLAAPGLDPRQVMLWALSLGGALLLALAAILTWNASLKRQVNRRTRELRQHLAEREQAEKALRVSEKRFRDIFDATNDAIFIHDIDTGAIVDVNRTMCDMYGVSREEALQASVEEFSAAVPPYTQKNALKWLERAKVNGPQLFEWHSRRKNGELFWAEINMRRAFVGADERIIVSARNISERHQQRAELEQVNRELRAINRLTQVCATTLDLDTLLERILDEACTVTGLEGGTICFVADDQTLHLAAHRNTSAATIRDLTTHSIRVGDCLCGNCARDCTPLILSTQAEVQHYATREATRDEGFTYHAAFPLVTGQRCIGVLCLFTRTERQPPPEAIRIIETLSNQLALAMNNARLHASLQQQNLLLEKRVRERTARLTEANLKLQELDRLKSLFIASMSHELRTPLNSVIGFSSIMLNEWSGPLTDDQRVNLEAILRAGRHLLDLISDIIDVSKIEADQLDINIASFNLNELLEELRQTFAEPAAGKGLELDIPSYDLPLTTDRRRLWQCLVNLVSNAVKYTEKGRIQVDCQYDEGCDQVSIRVCDTGIGISTTDQARLFQPFQRLETPLTGHIPGTGLGLYLTRRITEDVLAGRIELASTPEQGSTFSLTLPCHLDQDTPPSREVAS